MQSLLEHMRKVPDHRCARKKPHELGEMLVCLIAGYASGRTSVGRALIWCRNHLEMLQKYMKLEKGIASEATISRMLSGIDEEAFCLVFMEWVAEILRERGIHIVIDGKALRGATERIKGGNTPYVLNAMDAATQLVVGQLAVDEKSNEITSIPKLLDVLEVRDNIFTIDAIGTQRRIEEKITDNGGHFLLQVKGNHPALYEEIITSFELFEQEKTQQEEKRTGGLAQYMERLSRWEEQEKNRERIEYRCCTACTDATFLDCVREGEVSCIRSVGLATQIRIPIKKRADGEDVTVRLEDIRSKGREGSDYAEGNGGGWRIEKTGLISDMELTAAKMSEYKRRHWKIENNLHHVLDDAFREDRSSAKKSRNNLAVIRKYAYNVLQLAIIKEEPEWGIQRMMDHFCDCPDMVEKYVFDRIESFY